MWMDQFLRQARDGARLSSDALRSFVQGVAMGAVPDYQAAAWLMAVYQRGLHDDDTAALALAMRDAGCRIDLGHLPGIKVDKHSTGGVGDKISLALAPWVAACGVRVPMVAGRALGHTGGTLDKLESIPGFRVDLDIADFARQVEEVGTCIMGQTPELAPADRALYALRDVTATVESIPLITASILAKKLAEGCDALVLDVKVGAGAFMKDLASARLLARSLVRVGAGAGVHVTALMTRMDAPLGRTIGNALEVREAIAMLQGAGPADTTALTRALAVPMLVQGGVAQNAEAAQARLSAAIADGSAWAKFRQMVLAQGGQVRAVDEPQRLPSAPQQTHVAAPGDGFVQHLDALALGRAAMALGAGRSRKDDRVDPSVGIFIDCQVGERARAGAPVLTLHHSAPLLPQLLAQVRQAIVVGPRAPAPLPLVLEALGPQDLANARAPGF